MNYPKLSVRQVERVFTGPKGEKTQALLPVDYQVNENDFITILGPSGCGKSTLLRIVAGLDQPTRGEVWLDGELVDGPGADRGMVFQSYTLFPWLTVEQNIRFGLQERGVSKAAQKERSDYFINKVGLRGFEHHFPRQLSGGMQQRTAIARALANDPKVLLMDEPFGALDPVTREALQQEMIRIHRLLGRTIVLVTHDIDEALRLADHLVLMDGGEVVQQGEPLQMLLEPKNAFVETFFGRSELGVRLLSLRGVSDYLRRDERLAGDALNVTMTLREALSQFVAHRREVLPVVDEQGEACGTLHFADLLREEARREGAA